MSSSSRIDIAIDRSGLVRGALSVARRAHAGQTRQTGSGEIPFIEHPLAVAELLADEGYSDEVLAAAILHDIAEYTVVGTVELPGRFGEDVAALVEALTEDSSIECYEVRKREHRKRIAEAGLEAQAIFAADKTANVMVAREAYAVVGEEIDAEMPVSLDLKILVWEFDLEMLFDQSPGVALVDRFADQMLGLWNERAMKERAPC